MSITHERQNKDHWRLTIVHGHRRVYVKVGMVGSFWYARIDNASTPFDLVIHAFASVHIWMTKMGWRPGKHEQHPPAIIQGGITKNWERM